LAATSSAASPSAGALACSRLVDLISCALEDDRLCATDAQATAGFAHQILINTFSSTRQQFTGYLERASNRRYLDRRVTVSSDSHSTAQAKKIDAKHDDGHGEGFREHWLSSRC